jgi:hypothetical protein
LVVSIWGGLGNQMFGYAFAKALEHFTKRTFCATWQILL